MEGNATYVRNTGELASDVLTETTFELNDPQKTFTNTNFTYTWDLGNGYVKLCIDSAGTIETCACMIWFPMQRSDPWERASCPLPLLCIRKLHSEPESRSQCDWICTFPRRRLLQGCESAGSVIKSAFLTGMCQYLLLSTVLPNQEILYFQKPIFQTPSKTLSWRAPPIIRCPRIPAWLFTLMAGQLVYFLNVKFNWRTQVTHVHNSSPPMWVCWHFLPNCVADPKGGCTLTMLYENTLWLNHTFTSAGVHCLDISIQNDISKLQTSFSLSVKRNSEWMQEGVLVGVYWYDSRKKVTSMSSCHGEIMLEYLMIHLDLFVYYDLYWAL